MSPCGSAIRGPLPKPSAPSHSDFIYLGPVYGLGRFWISRDFKALRVQIRRERSGRLVTFTFRPAWFFIYLLRLDRQFKKRFVRIGFWRIYSEKVRLLKRYRGSFALRNVINLESLTLQRHLQKFYSEYLEIVKENNGGKRPKLRRLYRDLVKRLHRECLYRGAAYWFQIISNEPLDHELIRKVYDIYLQARAIGLIRPFKVFAHNLDRYNEAHAKIDATILENLFFDALEGKLDLKTAVKKLEEYFEQELRSRTGGIRYIYTIKKLLRRALREYKKFFKSIDFVDINLDYSRIRELASKRRILRKLSLRQVKELIKKRDVLQYLLYLAANYCEYSIFGFERNHYGLHTQVIFIVNKSPDGRYRIRMVYVRPRVVKLEVNGPYVMIGKYEVKMPFYAELGPFMIKFRATRVPIALRKIPYFRDKVKYILHPDYNRWTWIAYEYDVTDGIRPNMRPIKIYLIKGENFDLPSVVIDFEKREVRYVTERGERVIRNVTCVKF